MRINSRVVLAILVTLGLLTAGCMGQEESPFYGDEIKPKIPVDDFILIAVSYTHLRAHET